MIKRNNEGAMKVLDTINSKYGSKRSDGSVQKVASFVSDGSFNIDRLPSGIFVADLAMGGGIPLGRITGIDGNFSSGKSLMALKFVKMAQKHCRYCKNALTEKKGKVIVDKNTGEILDLRDFLYEKHPFWEKVLNDKSTKKIAKQGLSYYISFYINKIKDFSEDTKETEKGVIKLLKEHNLYFDEDSVYDCECGAAEPMMVFWMDSEGSWDSKWAVEKLGIDPEYIAISEPAAGEHAVDQVIHVMDSQEYDLVVVDSLGHFCSLNDLDISAEQEGRMGNAAKMVNRFQRRMVSSLTSKKDLNNPFALSCTVIQINHLTTNIKKGPMDFGPTRVRPGGVIQNFSESMSLRMGNARYDRDSKDGEPRFAEISFETIKNKTFAPKKKASFRMWIRSDEEKGITVGDTEEEKTVFTKALDINIINRTDSSYSFGKVKTTSQVEMINIMKTNKVFFNEVRKKTFDELVRN